MNKNLELEKFLSKRLTKEQKEGLNANSKLERVEESKEDNKLIIILSSELVDIINSDNGKNILKRNIIKFVRELKKELSIDAISYI